MKNFLTDVTIIFYTDFSINCFITSNIYITDYHMLMNGMG
jgi:hypothetical protein